MTIKIDEDTFSFLLVKLSVEKPLTIKRDDYETNRSLNLIAVRKDVNEKIKSNITEKLLNVVRNQKDEEGIYESYIEMKYKNCRSNAVCEDDFDNYTVELESLSEKGFDKAPLFQVTPKTPTNIKNTDLEASKTCFGGIFLMFGITIGGMWFLKSNKCQ